MKKGHIAALLGGLVLLAACSGMPMQASSSAQFVGSERCGGCHKDEYATWKNTLHARMVQPVRQGLLKDAGDNWAKDAKGTAGPAKGNVDGKAFTMNDVVMVVGSNWKQRYLVQNGATGNLQFMDKQWNRVHKQWEAYGNKNDWLTVCGTCHVTGYRLTSYDASNPSAQKVAYSELNIGCEACHGPGSTHAGSAGKTPMFNPAKATKEQASLVCGYCHVRKENEQFKTAQGNAREDQPHPVVGQSFKAGTDDWRTWYPEHMLIPGVNPNQPVSQNYPKTDLNDAFYLDEKAKAWGSHDARKHHQEYQEYLQSAHAKKDVLACGDCHTSHASKSRKMVDVNTVCAGCHGDKYAVDRIMPGTGQTALNLFIRTHTFNPRQDRPPQPTDTGAPPLTYYYK